MNGKSTFTASPKRAGDGGIPVVSGTWKFSRELQVEGERTLCRLSR